MNKKKMIKGLLIAGCITAFAGAFAACSDKATAEYTAEYGESFSLPRGISEYTVKNSKGEAVETSQGSFFVDDIGGYTVDVDGNEGAIIIKVTDTKAPVISTEKEVFFVEKGEKVAFGTVSAYDAYSGYIEPTAELITGDTATEILLENYKPLQEGVYTIRLSAKDAFQNEAVKEIYVDASADGKNYGRLASFSASYGLAQVETCFGLNAELTTEEKYGNESGSLKLTATGEVTTKSWSNYFRLKNLYQKDISKTLGMYFYVKNTSAMGKTLKIGEAYTVSLHPNRWTEVWLTTKDFSNIDYELSLDNSMSDITDLKFEFLSTNASRSGADEYYFSDIYYIPKTGIGEFRTKLLALTDLSTAEKQAEWKRLVRAWASYTQDEKFALTNMGIDVEGILDSLYLAHAAESDFTSTENKLVYADSALGAKQFTSKDSSGLLSYDATKSCDTNGKNETGSIKVKAGDSWGVSLTLDYPVVGDSFSTNDLDVDGDSVYSEISFSVYVEPIAGRNLVCKAFDERVSIPSGEWVELTFKTNNKTVNGATLYFYGESKETYMNWASGATFYMTSVYGVKGLSVSEVNEKLAAVIAADIPAAEFEDDALFIEAYEAFQGLSAAKRFRLTNATAFGNEIKEKLSEKYSLSADDNKALWLDTPLGEYQIGLRNAAAEYTTERAYGSEAGSLKLSVTAGAWDSGFYPLLPYAEATSKYTFYIYLEYTGKDRINFGSWSDDKKEFYLAANEWTRIELPVNAQVPMDEDYISVYCNDWAKALGQNITLYVSAVRAE
ncbi:MAG: hypothetical protein IJ514_02160 [Clostridia bacterium]|nr:hypothetical protein [Clostridia bacterium]